MAGAGRWRCCWRCMRSIQLSRPMAGSSNPWMRASSCRDCGSGNQASSRSRIAMEQGQRWHMQSAHCCLLPLTARHSICQQWRSALQQQAAQHRRQLAAKAT